MKMSVATVVIGGGVSNLTITGTGIIEKGVTFTTTTTAKSAATSTTSTTPAK